MTKILRSCFVDADTHFEVDLINLFPCQFIKKQFLRKGEDKLKSLKSKKSRRKSSKKKSNPKIPKHLFLYDNDDVSEIEDCDVSNTTMSTYEYIDESTACTDSMFGKSSSSSSFVNINNLQTRTLESSFDESSYLVSSQGCKDKYQVNNQSGDDKYDTKKECNNREVNDIVVRMRIQETTVDRFVREKTVTKLNSHRRHTSAHTSKIMHQNHNKDECQSIFGETLKLHRSTSSSTPVVRRISTSNYELTQNQLNGIPNYHEADSDDIFHSNSWQQSTVEESSHALAKAETFQPRYDNEREQSSFLELIPKRIQCRKNQISSGITIVAPFDLNPGLVVKANVGDTDIRAKVPQKGIKMGEKFVILTEASANRAVHTTLEEEEA